MIFKYAILNHNNTIQWIFVHFYSGLIITKLIYILQIKLKKYIILEKTVYDVKKEQIDEILKGNHSNIEENAALRVLLAKYNDLF